ncbi:type III secretion system chaperone family protein [Salinispora fenicalii]|uniref:YbjN domain-containing protein n=1 Tax=Salinispora fenicalii TaxID=1137263 RepID=UPI00048A184D|nr:YbjN domain-containing protein [Salinispora fenicalii]
MNGRSELGALIEAVCAERDLACEATGPNSYAVTLPGTHKLRTICNLIIGEYALRVEAFVMRQPDERREELWAWLLQRNARMYGVSFSIDAVGDVYLTGRMNSAGVDADELDRLFGSVLTYADESFDTMLEIGFGSSIRREWEWRVKRGESTANLAAFAHLVESADGGAAPSVADPTAAGHPTAAPGDSALS